MRGTAHRRFKDAGDRNLYKTHRVIKPDGSAFTYETKMAEPGPLESAAAVGPHTQGKGFATYSVAQRGAPDSPHSMQGMEKQRVQERIDRAGQKATIDALRTRPQAYRSTDKHALRMARPSKRHSPSRVMVVAQFCDGQDSPHMIEWGVKRSQVRVSPLRPHENT